MLNFGPLETTKKALNKIYLDIYRVGKFKDLWFYWDGKPLVMAHEQALDTYDEIDSEILEFFTFRNNDASYFTKEPNNNSWGWLSIYPQCKYGVDEKGKVEQIAVGVAQNATTSKLMVMNGLNILGRSYAYGDYSYNYKYRGETVVVTSDIENSKLYGINFQQQWDYAIKNNPEFVFVTGWNEWVAIRFKEVEGIGNAMVDQFNDEYSRDIEPSLGELKDHYYYQLAENIRRYKGVTKPSGAKAKKAIDIFADVSQWNDITSFNHYTKNTYLRDNAGYKTMQYKNNTMRNDIKKAKVAFDNNNVYFYVETVDNLTNYTDTSWMRLFLDTEQANQNSLDWEGFEYVINRINPTESTAYVERSIGGWNWESVGEARYSVKDNILQIEVPRNLLGFDGKGTPEFNFKWSDNMQSEDILDLYVNGDSAPGGRFMFHFTTKEVSDGLSEKTIIIITAILSLIFIISISIIVFIILKKRKGLLTDNKIKDII